MGQRSATREWEAEIAVSDQGATTVSRVDRKQRAIASARQQALWFHGLIESLRRTAVGRLLNCYVLMESYRTAGLGCLFVAMLRSHPKPTGQDYADQCILAYFVLATGLSSVRYSKGIFLLTDALHP